MASQPPNTRVSLLVRLRDPEDREAWKEFLRLYAAVIYGFARKRGLQDADAADLMQEVLRSLAGAIGRWNYDPSKGTFRGWLFSITRNKIHTFLESARRRTRGAGDSGLRKRLEEEPDHRDSDDEGDWDQEFARRTFHWAADRVKGEFQTNTWRAFWFTAVDGRNPKDVGVELGLSTGAVYVAKSRVLTRIRKEIEQNGVME